MLDGSSYPAYSPGAICLIYMKVIIKLEKLLVERESILSMLGQRLGGIGAYSI